MLVPRNNVKRDVHHSVTRATLKTFLVVLA